MRFGLALLVVGGLIAGAFSPAAADVVSPPPNNNTPTSSAQPPVGGRTSHTLPPATLLPPPPGSLLPGSTTFGYGPPVQQPPPPPPTLLPPPTADTQIRREVDQGTREVRSIQQETNDYYEYYEGNVRAGGGAMKQAAAGRLDNLRSRYQQLRERLGLSASGQSAADRRLLIGD